jgi:hypothetical protein
MVNFTRLRPVVSGRYVHVPDPDYRPILGTVELGGEETTFDFHTGNYQYFIFVLESGTIALVSYQEPNGGEVLEYATWHT